MIQLERRYDGSMAYRPGTRMCSKRDTVSCLPVLLEEPLAAACDLASVLFRICCTFLTWLMHTPLLKRIMMSTAFHVRHAYMKPPRTAVYAC